MTAVLNSICQRLAQIRDHRDGGVSWQQWLDEPLPLTPWQAWALLGLVRHRYRQEFVATTAQFRLQADLGAISTGGALAHPDIPQHGVVPGLSDWEYYFHGRGCCLTHRVTGESIDVDFDDSTADGFDPYFYANYLESLKQPTYVEERLILLHRSFKTIRLSMYQLLDQGLLERPGERGGLRLAFDYTEMGSLLESLEPRWENDETKLAMGAATGDWFLASGFDTAEAATKVAQNLADICNQQSSYLVTQFRNEIEQPDTLRALHEIDSPMLSTVIREALRGKPSGATSAALSVIRDSKDQKWCGEVSTLLTRINPNDEIPSPSIWHACAQFLLEQGQKLDIKTQLRNIKSNCLGDVSILALEHFPDIAIEVFHRALRSGIPCNRITAAAALAIIDQPWSRHELSAVLAESNDHVMTSECRSALMTTHSTKCQQLVLDWESRNPRKPEQGPFITMAEMSLRMSDGTIQWEMQNLHDRVMPLRSVILDPPIRSWWKFGR